MSEDSLVCVDGQQRVTTTCILVSALADHLTLLEESQPHQRQQCSALIKQAEQFLFNSESEVERLRGTPTSSDIAFYPFLTLLPPELDRKPFLMAILGRRKGRTVFGEYNNNYTIN